MPGAGPPPSRLASGLRAGAAPPAAARRPSGGRPGRRGRIATCRPPVPTPPRPGARSGEADPPAAGWSGRRDRRPRGLRRAVGRRPARRRRDPRPAVAVSRRPRPVRRRRRGPGAARPRHRSSDSRGRRCRRPTRHRAHLAELGPLPGPVPSPSATPSGLADHLAAADRRRPTPPRSARPSSPTSQRLLASVADAAGPGRRTGPARRRRRRVLPGRRRRPRRAGTGSARPARGRTPSTPPGCAPASDALTALVEAHRAAVHGDGVLAVRLAGAPRDAARAQLAGHAAAAAALVDLAGAAGVEVGPAQPAYVVERPVDAAAAAALALGLELDVAGAAGGAGGRDHRGLAGAGHRPGGGGRAHRAHVGCAAGLPRGAGPVLTAFSTPEVRSR